MLNFIFLRWRVPSHLPSQILAACDELRRASNQEQALRQAYDLVSGRFRARKWMTYVQLWRLFDCDLRRIWGRTAFLHCTHMNWLLKILLVRSGWFQEGDVRECWTVLSGFSPHQYLRVRLKNGKTVNVDPWAKRYGVRFGDYARGFNTVGK